MIYSCLKYKSLSGVADKGLKLLVLLSGEEPQIVAPPAPGLSHLQGPGLVVAGVRHHQAENTNLLLSG